MDFQVELKDAVARRETLRDEFQKNEGVISFLEYAIKREKEKCSQEILSEPSLSDNPTPE